MVMVTWERTENNQMDWAGVSWIYGHVVCHHFQQKAELCLKESSKDITWEAKAEQWAARNPSEFSRRKRRMSIHMHICLGTFEVFLEGHFTSFCYISSLHPIKSYVSFIFTRRIVKRSFVHLLAFHYFREMCWVLDPRVKPSLFMEVSAVVCGTHGLISTN